MSNINPAPDLQFQDFAPEAKPKQKPSQDPSKTYHFSNFPSSALDEDEGETGAGAEGAAPKSKKSFWSFEYYQEFFDVDTDQVVSRVINSMIPRIGVNFITQHLRPNPDLYGPFWICATLVFTLAASGNFASYFASAHKNEDFHWSVDFRMVTLSASVIFFYAWIVPLVIYAFMWYRKMELSYNYLEILCAYGYSLSIYVPISVLWTIQVVWLQWLLVGIGAMLSGLVLLFTFWPSLKSNRAGMGLVVMTVMLTLHTLLAVGCKYAFYATIEYGNNASADSNSSLPLTVSSSPSTSIAKIVTSSSTTSAKSLPPNVTTG